MFVHETKLRVRYGETDQMGVVYYGNYALYYEVARVEALRTIAKLPSASMHFEYEIFNEAGVLLHKGTTVLVFINMKTNRPVRCPEELYTQLKTYLALIQ